MRAGGAGGGIPSHGMVDGGFTCACAGFARVGRTAAVAMVVVVVTRHASCNGDPSREAKEAHIGKNLMVRGNCCGVASAPLLLVCTTN